jgi:serine/threonine protein kinase
VAPELGTDELSAKIKLVSDPGTTSVRLGGYEILGLLARGGMAEILLGRRAGSSELRVVKRMQPRLTSDPEMVQRFLAEARLALGFDHPNVIRAFELEDRAAEPLLVMEFLNGVNLGRIQRLLAQRGERLPLSLGVEIVARVCAGLHYAHERRHTDGLPMGIVHRDVSPYNVMMGFDGGTKLIDFGIAKGVQHAPATRTGTLRGTPPYMSPEQCRSEPVDRRSDVFSASILLWELTVGRPLYPRGSDLDTLNAITGADAQLPSEVVADYPPALESIVKKGLARVAADRFQTIAELGAALEPHRPPDSALRTSALRERMRELFPDEIDSPRLLAWVPPQATFAEGPRTEDLRAPHRARPRGRAALLLGAAGLAVAALSVMAWGRRDRSAKNPPPAVATSLPSAVAPQALASPAPAMSSAPSPSPIVRPPAAAPAVAERTHKRPSHGASANKHRHKAAGSRTRFDLDGPGLPSE